MEGNKGNNRTGNRWWHVARSLLWGGFFFLCWMGIASLVGKCIFDSKMRDIRLEQECKRSEELQYEQERDARNAKWREEARILDSIRAASDSVDAARRVAHPLKAGAAGVSSTSQPRHSSRPSHWGGSYSSSYSNNSHYDSYDEDEDEDDDDTWYHDEDDADEKYEYDYWE